MLLTQEDAMDYTKYKRNNKIYSGAEKKIGITINNQDYIVKFQKTERFGKRNNHISEYIGCRIFELMGFNVQETYLGTYDGEEVVVIKDFVEKGQQFVAFNDVGESSIDEDKERYQYSYDDIVEILKLNNKLSNQNETVSQFWKLYVMDALLGNFDRHGGNWGFIKENNKYRLAPVFDNGSCLFPKLTDESDMLNIIESEEETSKRIYKFPTSQILLNNKKSSYYDVINSLKYKECNEALKYVYEKFNLSEVNELLFSTKFVSNTQHAFYHHMIMNRFNKIIKESYERLCEHENA